MVIRIIIMSTESVLRFSLPQEVQVNEQIFLYRVTTDDREISDAASVFDVSKGDMKRALQDERLVICEVRKKKTEKIGHLLLERFDSAKELENRIRDKRAARLIFDEEKLRYAASMYLKKAHCGQGIGSQIVQTLRDGDFPIMKKVFQLVDNKNSASTALQKKFKMAKITDFYVPSCLDYIFCCVKLGQKATAYKMAKS